MNVTNIMSHNNHQAIINYCGESNTFRGEVLGLTGIVDFYSDSIDGLKVEFQKSLDLYLELCQKHGVSAYLS